MSDYISADTVSIKLHDPAEDISIAFDDPELAIPWPLPVTAMSPRDRAALPLAAALKQLTN